MNFIGLLLLLMVCFPGCEADQSSIIGSSFEGYWPAWSVDSKWLLYSKDNDLWMKSIASGEDKLVALGDGREYHACWDPSDSEGRMVFVNENSSVYSLVVLDLSPYEETIWYSSNSKLSFPIFFRDGNRILFLEENITGIRFLENIDDSPQEISNQAGWGQRLTCIQPSGTRDQIVYVVQGEDDSFNIVSISALEGTVDTLINKKQTEKYGYWIHYAAESPDGNSIVYYEAEWERHEYSEDAGFNYTLSLLTFNQITQTTDVIKRSAPIGGVNFSYSTPLPLSYAITWSPDGESIAYAWLYDLDLIHGTFNEAIYVDKF